MNLNFLNRLSATCRPSRFVLVIFSCLLIACTGFNAKHNNSDTYTVELGLFSEPLSENTDTETAEQFIASVLQRMSLHEKVAQMVQGEIKYVTPADVSTYGLGSVLNGGGSHPQGNKHASVEEWLALAQRYHHASISNEKSRTPIPLLWGTDAVHGHNNLFGATIFPHNIGLGAADNPALTHAVFAATAADVRATGIKWVFSPTVAVARDDRWGRTYESFSENPDIASRLASAAVAGLQGEAVSELTHDSRVVATAKHFIGDGGTHDGIDQGDTRLTEAQLMDIHGQSFKAALDAGAQTVMASFNSWNGVKVHTHRYLLTDLLKHHMGFDGFVIGDWNAHDQIAGCTKDACAAAINAGVDMLMAPEDWKALIANTVTQVENGEISEQRIDDAVTRILRVKYRAGLFAASDFTDAAPQPDTSEQQAIARRAVQESLVLLKNNNNTLPLAANKTLLVLGNAADSMAQQTGGWTLTWQGDGNANSDFPNGTTLLDGIKETIESHGGSVTYDPNTAQTMQKKSLTDYDAAVLVFGEQPYAEGAGDLDALRAPIDAARYLPVLRKLADNNVPTVVIFLTGRPLSVNPFINLADAFVVAWLPGSEGAGVADVIIGDAFKQPRTNFKGKLAFSWPVSATQYNLNNYPQYSDQPQFEVGYGLTYQSSQQLAWLPELDEPYPQTIMPTGSLSIFAKKVFEPWTIFVGSDENWGVPVIGNAGATQDLETVQVAPTDRATQEDARRVKWSKRKTGQFYFQHNDRMDLTLLAEQNAHLNFQVRVLQQPKSSVALRMDCHYPCSGAVDVTPLLRSLPAKQWHVVSVPLTCFAQQGAELDKINTPFLLSTDDELTLEISDIYIDSSNLSAQQVDCVNPA